MPGSGNFQINDIVLNIPPEQISCQRQSFNHQWQTLRTRASIKSKSGFSQWHIIINVHFSSHYSDSTGRNGIEQLRDLVSQFRVTPFCYVENQHLRDSILAGDNRHSMALALRQLEIRTTPNEPGDIEATFQFAWFNYLPFTPNFSFRKHLFNPTEVKDPRDSEIWKLMYRAEQRRWDQKTSHTLAPSSSWDSQFEGNSLMYLSTYQYATINVEKYRKLEKEYDAIKKLRDTLQDLSAGGRHEGSLDTVLMDELTKSLGEYDRVEVRALMEDVFGTTTSMSDPVDNPQIAAELLDTLNKSLNENTYSRFQTIVDQEKWEVVLTNSGEAIKIQDSPTALKKKIGEASKKDQIMIRRERDIALKSQLGGLIVQGMSISFENILATVPLNGHQFPTYQHIGSTDAVVTLSVETTDNESLQDLTNFYNIVESQAYQFRNVPQGQRNVIVKYNNLLGLLGLADFLPENMSITTVPGNPGTSAITLTLLENPITADTREKIAQNQSFTTDLGLRQEVASILLKHLRKTSDDFVTVSKGKVVWNATKGIWQTAKDLASGAFQEELAREVLNKQKEHTRTKLLEHVPLVTDPNYARPYQYTGSKTGGRDDIFKSLCLRFGREFSKTMGKIKEGVDNVAFIAGKEPAYFKALAFYSLDNDDVIGVERMQEDLLPHVTSKEGFKGKGLGILRNDARTEFTRKTEERSSLLDWKRAAAAQGEDLDRLSERRIEHLEEYARWPEKFMNEYMNAWVVFAATFIDAEIFKSGLVYELHEFDGIRKQLQDTSYGAAENAYPDFPLTEVVDLLSEEGGTTWAEAKNRLELMLLKDDARFKGIDYSAFIGPDCYFFNRTDVLATRLLTKEIVQQASEAITVSHQARPKVEDNWFETEYNQRLGSKKLDKMKSDFVTVKEFPIRTDKKDDAETKKRKEELADKIRSQINSRLSWESDYITAGEGLRCSTLEHKEAYGPIEHVAISETSAENTATNQRPAYNQEPPTHAAEVLHRFGLDSLQYLSQIAYSLPQEGWIGDQGPDFAWPTTSEVLGCSSGYGWRTRSSKLKVNPGKLQFHKGIDIVGGIEKRFNRRATNGAPVKAAQSGRIVYMSDPKKAGKSQKGAGVYVQLEHERWGRKEWYSLYMHMQDDEYAERTYWKYKNDPVVIKGERIGSIGSTGGSTGPHLHFEIRYKGGDRGLHLPPEAKNKDGSYSMPIKSQRAYHSKFGPFRGGGVGVLSGDVYAAQGPPPPSAQEDPDSQSLLSKSVDQFEKDIKSGQGPSMARAYPTFRLYFIESDLGERKRFLFDDFFAYSSVKEIQLIRNRKLAADLCMIQVTNISGALSNRKFKGTNKEEDALNNGKTTEEDAFNPSAVNTINENPITSMMLKPGIQVQLRLGYNSNPEELKKVFNGVITDVQFSENDDLVNITCQSFAVELVQEMHGDGATFGGWFSDTGRTAKILEELMASPEVAHFGRWQGGAAKNSLRGLLTDRWTFVPQPQDDNIFAPTGPGALWSLFDFTSKYILYQSTIWDVFQEMTMRHPGYITYPVPFEGKYGPRMTMFFGVPDQLYFSRDPSFAEENQLGQIRRSIRAAVDVAEDKEETNKKVLNDASANLSDPEKESFKNNMDPKTSKELQAAADSMLQGVLRDFALDKQIIKPFRAYHVLTGSHHIMFNNMSSSSYSTFNVATVQYSDDEPEKDKKSGTVTFDDATTFTLACDAALPDEDKREVFAQYPNCVGYEMAKRYALSLLHQTLREGYRGSLVIVGNPAIKPHDVCYIFDEYTDMYGPIEVEQVVHKFSQQNGFITEITPDMCIHVNQHTTMATSDAMGLIAEHYLGSTGYKILSAAHTAAEAASIGATGGLAWSGSPLAGMILNNGDNSLDQDRPASLVTMAGTFIFRKLITRTQMAHPFRYSPLVKNGRPMIGGFPNDTTDGSFIQGIKTWIKDWDKNVGLFIDDYYDKIHPSSWYGHSGGSFYDHLFRGRK